MTWKPHGDALTVDEDLPLGDEELIPERELIAFLDAPLPKPEATTALIPDAELYSRGQARDRRGRFSGPGGGGGGAEPKFREITEARGNSRAVSHEEFQRLATEGQAKLDVLRANGSPPRGLDRNWDSVKADAFAESQRSWGGVTVDAHTGRPLHAKTGYALSIKNNAESVSVHEHASEAEFGTAMDRARTKFGAQLSMDTAHLGVFHDDELHRIDIDPVIVVHSLHDVETIGAATHAIGGAYNYADGNGYWPPHVASSPSKAAAALMADADGGQHWRGLGEWYAYVRRVQHGGKAETPPPPKGSAVVSNQFGPDLDSEWIEDTDVDLYSRGQARDRRGRFAGSGGGRGGTELEQGTPKAIHHEGGEHAISPLDAESMQLDMFAKTPPPWSVRQRGALTRYTDHAVCMRINGTLRGHEKVKDPGDTAEVAVMRSAMKPTTEAVTVVRGVHAHMFGGAGQKLTESEASGLVGRTFHDRGFTSTTVTASSAYSGTILHITVPKGTRAAYLEGLTEVKGEHELLLDRGTHFHIDRAGGGPPPNLYVTVVGQNA